MIGKIHSMKNLGLKPENMNMETVSELPSGWVQADNSNFFVFIANKRKFDGLFVQ